MVTSGNSLSLFRGTCSSSSFERNPNSRGRRSNLFLLIRNSLSFVSAHISIGRYLKKLLSILSFSKFMRLHMSRGIFVRKLLFRLSVVKHLKFTRKEGKTRSLYTFISYRICITLQQGNLNFIKVLLTASLPISLA